MEENSITLILGIVSIVMQLSVIVFVFGVVRQQVKQNTFDIKKNDDKLEEHSRDITYLKIKEAEALKDIKSINITMDKMFKVLESKHGKSV